MAHFAKLNEDNHVLEVVVVNNDVITVDGVEIEQVGIDFLTQLTGHPYWKQTSYNANTRKNFAGTGFKYDSEKDAFIPPQPFSSWILDEINYKWNPPVPYPEDGKKYTWVEKTQEWI